MTNTVLSHRLGTLRVWAVLSVLLLLAACAPTPEPTAVAMLAPNRLIAFWETVQDTPSDAFEGQPYQFVAAQGDDIRLILDSASAGNTLALRDADGAVLARGNDIRYTLEADGVYTAFVGFTPGDATPYTLTLEYTDRFDPSRPTPTPSMTPTATPSITPSPTPTPTLVVDAIGELIGEVFSGVPVAGSIARSSAAQVYEYDGVADQYVTIEMEGVSGRIDPVIALYDPRGNALAMDDNTGDNGDALLRNVRLPETGRYLVQVGGDGGTGDFRLSLIGSEERQPVTPVIPEPTPTVAVTNPPPPSADRLLDHIPMPGRIEQPGDFVRYPIVAQAGEVMTIGVSPVAGSPIRPEIELFSPSGELVEAASIYTTNAGGDAIVGGHLASETGTYVALVQAEGGGTGEFVIGYGRGSSYDTTLRGTAAADTPVTGEVTRRGLRDVWHVYLNRDDVITVTANPSSVSFDPVLEIAAPDGTIIAQDDNSGGGSVPSVNRLRIPETGQYAIRVTGANAGSSGGYTLVWRYVVAAPTATPPAAVIMLLSADSDAPEQSYVFFPFQGQRGQRVLVRVQAGEDSPIDPVLALLTADGTLLAQSDDRGDDLNPALEFVLPTDGTYIARVNGYGDTSGAFEITVEALY